MAHPKRKISKTRRDKRRTHYKFQNKQLKFVKKQVSHTCIIEAFENEGKIYYKGKLFSDS